MRETNGSSDHQSVPVIRQQRANWTVAEEELTALAHDATDPFVLVIAAGQRKAVGRRMEAGAGCAMPGLQQIRCSRPCVSRTEC
jgi:hypothetical protein